MKLVYTHENKILVENAKNLLSQNNIESVVRNEFIASGLGELAAITSWPELWIIHEEDFSRAKTLIAQLADDTGNGEWECGYCQEVNDLSFDICWKCQKARPQ